MQADASRDAEHSERHDQRDPEMPTARPAWLGLISRLEATDDHTIVAYWKEPSFLAGGVGAADIPALPRHLLADQYRDLDRPTFINASYWTSDFVGLGPYR